MQVFAGPEDVHSSSSCPADKGTKCEDVSDSPSATASTLPSDAPDQRASQGQSDILNISLIPQCKEEI